MTQILIVDDQEQNRYLLQIMLQAQGYEARSASNGIEALEMARREAPDLIITDILMPGMDGFSLCRAWMADATLQHVPLIFYTATYTDPQDETFALSLGAARFIVKPAEPDAFVEIVHQVLANHAAQRLTPLNEPSQTEVYYQQYNQALIRKLEDKMAQIEEANRSLERDVAARKHVEKTLRETLADLERSNADLQQFAYVASHDLQEPLRMVASYVQLLGIRYQGRLDADADEFIGYAVEGATRMQQLILDLLEYARVGTRGLPRQPTDATAVCQAALRDLEPAIAENHATVVCAPLPTVLADPPQLRQLFQNLIANAIKFHGAAPPVVQVSAELQTAEYEMQNGAADSAPRTPHSALRPPHWVFAVRDNGISIEPQYFDRIFVIFQRLHSRREYPGTGIGLAICKKIVERHGGRIWVESAPGQGATFYFTLPATE